MSSALQVYYADFDSAFFQLPSHLRGRIEAKIDEMGRDMWTLINTNDSCVFVSAVEAAVLSRKRFLEIARR